MARKAFSGDLVHELPKGKIEPYRLWFEYLKFALQTCPARVNRNFYESWGVVDTADFDEWFQQNWKRLFATPASVSFLTDAKDVDEALKEPDVRIIKVSCTAPIRRQISDFTKALRTLPKARKASIEPQFVITSKRSMSLESLRVMLNFLKKLEDKKDLEDAAKAYLDWAEAWNTKVKQKKLKRSEIHIPKLIRDFVKEVNLHQANQAKSKTTVKRSGEYNFLRSDLNRFKRRAERVLTNVARGQFPGDY